MTAVAALVAAASAPAAPPGDTPAVDIYRESLPSSGGSVVPDARAERLVELAPAVEERIRRSAGADADALVRVARSSLYGARASTAATHGPTAEDGPGAAGTPAAADAPASVVTTPRALLILALLGIVSATAIVVGVRHGRASVLGGAHESRDIVD